MATSAYKKCPYCGGNYSASNIGAHKIVCPVKLRKQEEARRTRARLRK